MSRVSAPARGRTLLLRFHGAAPSGITRDERVDQAFELFDAATRHAEPSRHLLDGGNRSRKHRSSCVSHDVRVTARAQKRQCPLTDALLVDSCLERGTLDAAMSGTKPGLGRAFAQPGAPPTVATVSQLCGGGNCRRSVATPSFTSENGIG